MQVEDPKAIEALCLFYKDKLEQAERLVDGLNDKIKNSHDWIMQIEKDRHELNGRNDRLHKELGDLQIENDELIKRFKTIEYFFTNIYHGNPDYDTISKQAGEILESFGVKI